jgi:REP element-mobilizing transposase RayT
MHVTNRRLPHVYVIGQPLFVTFRLHGSLPQGRHFPKGPLASGEAFVCLDRLLDQAVFGPQFLRIPRIADIVKRAIEEGSPEDYTLHAWVVMPNHVHLLVTPITDPSDILRHLKGSTAREANRQLGREGKPFWQHESHDRLVRNPKEFRRIERYIVLNPVRAGIVASPEKHQWSSVSQEQAD